MQKMYQIQYHNQKQNQNAYLTVGISLIFGIVLSLILVLIEGAAVGAMRLQSEIVADLGLDSVFAEYNRELLDQYGVFFIDSSYGTVNGGVGMIESHLSDYMGYNLNPKNDQYLRNIQSMLLYLDNSYLEIDRISYATDDNALVWKSMAVDYLKSTWGGDAISEVQDYINKVEEYGLNTRDVIGELNEMKSQVDERLDEEENIEYGAVSGDGYSYEKVINVFDDVVGGTILEMVMPSEDKVSSAVIEGGPYYSSRAKNGTVNSGNGLHSCIDKADGVLDELLYNEYLMKMCGTYTNNKDKGLLKYQIEYIIYGYNSDSANIKNSVEALFALRAASNMVAIMNDSGKKGEVELIVTAICTLLGMPEIAEAITAIVLGMWAVAEAFSDVRILLEDGRIPLIKSSDEWNVSLVDLFCLDIYGGSNKTKGLSYNDYLRIFINFVDKNDKLARSLDIVEMDIRQTLGNQGFRIDRCVDYVSVKFGFIDGYGHEFLISRSKCYE